MSAALHAAPYNVRQVERAEHFPTRIAEQIRHDIVLGKLAPGMRLPTELQLKDMFGVSRTVVREAIAQLRTEGLVESRQGVGAFVTDADRRRSIQIGAQGPVSAHQFRDLFQLRVPLEIEAAGLAALNHEAEHLERMDAAQARMVGCPRWADEWIEADLEFHTALAMATQNEYFSLFLGYVGAHLGESMKAGRIQSALPHIVEVTLQEHTAIRDAVAARDAMAARLAMARHIAGAAQRLGMPFDLPLQVYAPDLYAPESSGARAKAVAKSAKSVKPSAARVVTKAATKTVAKATAKTAAKTATKKTVKTTLKAAPKTRAGAAAKTSTKTARKKTGVK